jgi:diaminohydroxyphosphoribosylaminopyrimidine deaminase/5-amino-6-(5-phosphoribosylamino)uracil reductase
VQPTITGPLGDVDAAMMALALEAAETVRGTTAPNPWVGAVVLTVAGGIHVGATAAPGGHHAEVAALRAAAAAGDPVAGATLYSTLEPCAHHGRTPPCTDAIVTAGIGRVVVALRDPDPAVSGAGIDRLDSAGVRVTLGVRADEAAEQLAPYLKHRRTGRPWVICKLAATMDGRTAAPDGTSRWITGPEARQDVHRLRAQSDAVAVGAGTVRADDPELTVRLGPGSEPTGPQPLRVVFGHAPAGARVRPALELSGDLGEILDELGRRGVLQLLVEGGPTVLHDLHAAGLVDRYVVYLAPALLGGDDGRPMFSGPGAASIGSAWRGRFLSVTRLGEDLRIELAGPAPSTPDPDVR